VDEVAAIAAGAAGLRAGGMAACWRVAGANAGAAAAGAGAAGAAATGAVLLGKKDLAALVAGVAAVVFGTTLRAIGRGFGNGTFGFAQTSVPTTSPIAKARPVASAVDRNTAAWTDRVTGFPADESFDLTSPESDKTRI